MSKINTGSKAVDKLTGFAGTVTARIEYITGCIQYQLQPYGLKEGKVIEPQWFDESRLDAVDESSAKRRDDASSGGPVTSMPTPQHP